MINMDIVKEVAFDYALEHYSKRFKTSIDDRHVIMNASSNSYIFEDDAIFFIQGYLDRLNNRALDAYYKALNELDNND